MTYFSSKLWFFPGWRQFLGHLDLSLATSLKSLSIETRSDDSHESINHIFLSILQQLSSPQIEEISLRLDTATFIHKSTLHAIDWNALDDFLDGKLFRKLRRLVFSVGRYSGAFKDNQEAVLRSLAKDIVLKSFGKAEKRGVEVSYVYGNLKAR